MQVILELLSNPQYADELVQALQGIQLLQQLETCVDSSSQPVALGNEQTETLKELSAMIADIQQLHTSADPAEVAETLNKLISACQRVVTSLQVQLHIPVDMQHQLNTELARFNRVCKAPGDSSEDGRQLLEAIQVRLT